MGNKGSVESSGPRGREWVYSYRFYEEGGWEGGSFLLFVLYLAVVRYSQ